MIPPLTLQGVEIVWDAIIRDYEPPSLILVSTEYRDTLLHVARYPAQMRAFRNLGRSGDRRVARYAYLRIRELRSSLACK